MRTLEKPVDIKAILSVDFKFYIPSQMQKASVIHILKKGARSH